MVSLGFVPQPKRIPAPDLSFVRLFDDTSVGWQLRGQYAFWNGASSNDRFKYRLLERVGNRVAPVAYTDGQPVFHKINAGTAFIILGLIGYWLTFDSDAMWLDVPHDGGQYAILAVGGSAEKPSRADVSWTCPQCGSVIGERTFTISTSGFTRFLAQADTYAAECNEDTDLLTCGSCGTVHPPAPGLIRETAAATPKTEATSA